MQIVTTTKARAQLYRLVEQVNQTHMPVTLTSSRGDAVLLSAEDWEALQETVALAMVPGFAKSVRQARSEGISTAATEIQW